MTKQALREVLKFLSGAQAFHLLTHIWFQIHGQFPFKFFFVTVTEMSNARAIFYNTLILLGLIYFAYLYKKDKSKRSK